MAARLSANCRSMTGARNGSATISTAKPISIVSGNPMAKILSCGAARVSTPSAMLVINSAASSGKDSVRAKAKMVPPHWVTANTPDGAVRGDSGKT